MQGTEVGLHPQMCMALLELVCLLSYCREKVVLPGIVGKLESSGGGGAGVRVMVAQQCCGSHDVMGTQRYSNIPGKMCL